MHFWFNTFLDLLLPEKPLARALRAMSAEEFAARAARAEERTGKDTVSLFDYRDPLVKEAVWQLKYRGNKKTAMLLASLLYDELLAFLAEYADMTTFTEPLVIPIPLSIARERERGYNQCNLLVDELVRLDVVSSSSTQLRGGLRWGGVQTTSRPVCMHPPARVHSRAERTGRNFSVSKTALVKIKDTPSQTKTESRKERRKNLNNCFSAGKEVAGRNIILVDDVATTGATIEEARQTLLNAGAKKVIAFTIAH